MGPRMDHLRMLMVDHFECDDIRYNNYYVGIVRQGEI